MKITRKKGISKIKIEHNRVLFWIIIILMILLVILIWFITHPKEETQNNQNNSVGDKFYCETDEDCVPDSCCHAIICLNAKYKPDCSGIFCSQVCSGPLDCGAGSCKCISNGCAVISNAK